MIRLPVLLAALVLTVPLAAQEAFSLKNTDPSAVFYWWSVGNAPADPPGFLGVVTASAVKHPVAPGETVSGVLGPDSRLVGVFVPWAEGSLRAPLTGGWLPASELPDRGTVLVDRPGFAAAVKGREIPGSRAEWGLEPPLLVLDGLSEDWKTVPVLREWGPGFQPEEGPWPPGFPRIRTLQAADRDGALWVRVVFDGAGPTGLTGSLLLNRPGASLEFPLAGNERRVWQWLESGSRPAGSRLLAGGVLEAWVRWDRLPAADRASWMKLPAEWVLAVSGPGNSVKTYRLASFSGEDLP